MLLNITAIYILVVVVLVNAIVIQYFLVSANIQLLSTETETSENKERSP